MIKIKFKTFLSIVVGKILINVSKLLFKGGSNFPGRVCLKIDKAILVTAAQGYRIILVTGTNGKTTTTSMIYNMISDSGKNVITNNTGANMLPGIVSCFINHYSIKKNTEKFAVIEVDEANVKLITEHISPEIITVTNLFRDQLDRYGEVYTTLNKIMDGIKKSPETLLILNGDESLLGDIELSNKVLYYGFNASLDDNKIIDINADAKFCKKCKAPYKYNFITYNHLGDFYCDNCGYKRPQLTYQIDEIIAVTPEGSLVRINNDEYYINQPGTYNIYNGLCAFAVAAALDINKLIISNSLKNQQSSFGRQESLTINGKATKIILVKNPAGFNQAIDTVSLDKRKFTLSLLLNDNYADGRDVSWIWDVNFEKFSSLDIHKVLISGIRLYDMAVRVKIAGLDMNKFIICEQYENLLKAISEAETDTVYILATYTAMINFRKYLHSKGFIKDLW